MKHFLLTLFALCLFATGAHATGYETINGLKYLINTDEKTATLVANAYSGDIVVPEKVTVDGADYPVVAFGDQCFSSCSSLTSIIIPSSVTSLGSYCFYNCRLLTSIVIPSSVTNLGDHCFFSCYKITSISIPSSVTSIGSYCFSGCKSLTSITIPSSVTSLGTSCFSLCSSLTSIIIPSSVTSLGDYCFYKCSSLTSIIIPSSVTSLGSFCFDQCTNLEAVYCYTTTPPTVGSSLGSLTAILYVPAASIDKYKAATGWKEFTVISAIPGTEKEDPETKKCEMPAIAFADGKLRFESATSGAVYHYTLTCSDVAADAYSEDGVVALEAAYAITAYATADGYSQSEKASATLYWVEKATGTETSIINAEKRGVVISARDGIVTLSGLTDGEKVSFYSTSGSLLGTATASGGVASAAFTSGQVIIAKVGQSSLKVSL